MERVVTITPSGGVLEQDFILQVRRLQRDTTPHWVVNILFSNMPAVQSSPSLLEAAHDKLQQLAAAENGRLHLMTNGDAFVVLPTRAAADPTFGAQLLQAALPEGINPGRTPIALVNTYPMPDAYAELRERVDFYVQQAKLIEEQQAETPEVLLQAADVAGPLTAYALAQIERLLDDLDIRSYVRQQRVFERQGENRWTINYEENFIAVRDLHMQKFPKLEIKYTSRLFLEMASMLDRRMLSYMLRAQEVWREKNIGLNLSVGTVLSSTFAQFCHVVHGDLRRHVFFELQITELLHDFKGFQNAVALMTAEGFNVVIDGVQPDYLPYLRLNGLPVSAIKIAADEAMLPQLQDHNILHSLRKIDPQKVVLYRVDSQAALNIGTTLGIQRYQGFLLDKQLQAAR